MHLFGHTLDHDYYFELSREGERDMSALEKSFSICFAGGTIRGQTLGFGMLLIFDQKTRELRRKYYVMRVSERPP